MKSRSSRSAFAAVLVTALIALGVAACGGDDDSSSNGGGGGGDSGGGGKTIALLLPETKTTRYEEKDRPLFEAKVKELCPDCKVFYQNASQDANKQQQQADAAITKGASVLVLDAVDVASVGPIVQHANQKNIPVIAYDRLIPDQDIAFYVSFDNVKQGRVQAQSLLDKLGSADGKSIVMVNGAPTDPSAGDYKKGAHQVFDKSGLKIAKEFDTPDWSPDKAQTEMDQSITSLGKDGFVGVYSANDGMAGGIIAAMKGAGIDPKTKPVTGGDSEAAAIQRILTGEQLSTIYLAIKQQAETAAQLAVAAAQGKMDPDGLAKDKVDNGAKQVDSVLLDPIAVTKDNIQDTVIKDGFLTVDEICTGKYADACKEAGIQ
ncbi:MAG TPA: substrate-binding domain-containing protein [Thermoleophilaceae bacterium]|nr:substrate-binding domain-containing protein [Thermoleophilaceae bacterium]